MIDSLKRPALLALAVALGSAGSAQAAETMDHGQVQHGQMDHGAMDHSQMNHGSMEHPQKQPDGYGSRAPIPVPTDADRAAAFPDLPPHTMHAGGINSYFLLDQLEYQDADDASVLSWDASGWIGGDINRLWLRSEGERSNGTTEEAEVQALYGRAVSPWWELVAGVRQDFKPGSPQTWAAFGAQGMPLYGLETKATAYLGESSQSALRLEAEYDILLTNRLILQPLAEVNLYGRNDHERGVGSGLANTELGLRLRYEIVPQFAPYVGVTWNRNYGNTADFAREEGEDNDEARFVAGIRFWF
ncbi:copper resistance protein B [Metapseudomonas resinovorans]|uniref:copper resistance protein B n=1 Tax=Metapseudomonas resinovorans TaxID=53412 RepID=UPI0003FFD4D1|nr:copper resistance protein B [Pseudomonas resinovorans]